MIVCWSPKGGSGCTVVSSVLALELGRIADTPSLLVDPSGDASVVLGTDSDGPGIADWMTSSVEVPLDSLRRLPVEVTPRLGLLAAGTAGGSTEARQAARLRDAFVDRPVVVDAGADSDADVFVDVSTVSVLVLRPCFLAVRRASKAGLHADGFVLVEEDGRTLDARDVEDVTGVEHFATVGWDAAVARLVDAGRMKSRLPRSLRPLQRLATTLSNEARSDRNDRLAS